VCGVCFVRSSTCARNECLLSVQALASRGPLICPHWHIPFDLGYVSDSLERTQSIGYASFAPYVCIDDTLKLQHAQHDVHPHPHSPDGRVAHTLSLFLDLQEWVCGVWFCWF